ncbi:MAG: hypothetical protein QXO74_04090 [Candidatus Methanomethylicia archaeon]
MSLSMDTIVTIVAAGITLMLFSWLYKENRFFRIAEHAYMGAAAAYTTLISVDTAWVYLYDYVSKGQWWWWLTVPIGLLYIFFFTRKYFYLYRYPTAIVLGTSIGTIVARYIKTQFLEQIRSTISESTTTAVLLPKPLDGVLVAIGVLTALFYFYFTAEFKGPLNTVAKIGRYTLVAGFGGSFGLTIMSRISLFIGRIRFLYFTYPAPYVCVIAAIALVVAVALDYMKKSK